MKSLFLNTLSFLRLGHLFRRHDTTLATAVLAAKEHKDKQIKVPTTVKKTMRTRPAKAKKTSRRLVRMNLLSPWPYSHDTNRTRRAYRAVKRLRPYIYLILRKPLNQPCHHSCNFA